MPRLGISHRNAYPGTGAGEVVGTRPDIILAPQLFTQQPDELQPQGCRGSRIDLRREARTIITDLDGQNAVLLICRNREAVGIGMADRIGNSFVQYQSQRDSGIQIKLHRFGLDDNLQTAAAGCAVQDSDQFIEIPGELDTLQPLGFVQLFVNQGHRGDPLVGILQSGPGLGRHRVDLQM